MATPQQVKDRAKAAEELQKKVYSVDEPGITGDPAPAADVDKDKPVNPEQTKDTPSTSQQTVDNFQQRYYSLKGKYDAEVPRLSAQIRDLTATVQDLTEKLTNNKQPDPNNIPAEADTLNPDDFSSFGPEFEKLAKKLNDTVAENDVLKEKINTLTGTVDEVKTSQVNTTYNDYIKEVAKALSDGGHNFEQLNRDPAFLKWLSLPDTDTGRPRIEGLNSAERALDVGWTMVVFNDYLSSLTPEPPAEDPGLNLVPDNLAPPAPQSEPTYPNMQPPASQSGSDTTPPNQQDKRKWTRAEIKKFYQEKALGLYNKRPVTPEQLDILERDILAAPQEGRVVG